MIVTRVQRNGYDPPVPARGLPWPRRIAEARKRPHLKLAALAPVPAPARRCGA